MKHNNYFDGRIQSIRFSTSDGDVSVGSIEPGEYSFTTETPEHVEVLTGSLQVVVSGNAKDVSAGSAYDVPARTTFSVACNAPVSYLCFFRTKLEAECTQTLLTVPPVLDRTPTLIQTIIDGLNNDVLNWQPSEERWSVRMVIAHLAEAEVNCFRARLMAVASSADENSVLPKYDQLAAFKKGQLPSTTDALANFRRERDVSLQFLHALPATVGSRTCRHERLGILTFLEMLNEYAFHDMGHMRQILELCRARAYYPHIGGWRTYYKVNP